MAARRPAAARPIGAGRRVALILAVGTAAVVAGLLAAGLLDQALAQAGPFGVPRPPAAPPAGGGVGGGVGGWILAKQAEFYRAMSGTIRAARQDGSAVTTLLGISFAYGVFHAAGPGHGKAVISSYLVANAETWRRGVVLSFASALLQALVAVAVVGVAAALIGATARQMGQAVWAIEVVSYALIAAVGARLLWVKGRALIAAWPGGAEPAVAGHAQPCAQHGGHAQCGHDHHHHHDHHHQADDCGHAHGPEPQQLAGPGGWKRGLSAIVAVGLRPCSGAILVLVFALAQGLFWAGVAATFAMGLGTAVTVAAIASLAVGARAAAARFARSPSGYGLLALRGVEFAAAALVLAFGILLLTGYLADERLFGV